MFLLSPFKHNHIILWPFHKFSNTSQVITLLKTSIAYLVILMNFATVLGAYNCKLRYKSRYKSRSPGTNTIIDNATDGHSLTCHVLIALYRFLVDSLHVYRVTYKAVTSTCLPSELVMV